MKVVAFNGSPRGDSNTAILLRHVFAELTKEGIETEVISLARKPLRGCLGCYKCYVNQNRQCIQSKDALNEYVEKMVQADGIILASPVYVCSVPSEMKALIDRATMVNKANGGLLRRKVGAALVAVRRGGMITALDTMNHFFLLSEMIVPGSSYWNFAFGLEKGDVDKDTEGIQTIQVLGQNMAWLIKKLYGGG
ncbi:MAG: flavodoxin family protein [Dehalococcoidia bacterium]|nr:flavodoxin family protein [Dehalococcoidia bacterium]